MTSFKVDDDSLQMLLRILADVNQHLGVKGPQAVRSITFRFNDEEALYRPSMIDPLKALGFEVAALDGDALLITWQDA